MKNPIVTIRLGRPADFADIQRLNAALFRFEDPLNGHSRNLDWPFSDEGVQYYQKCVHARDDHQAFIAEADGQTIGYLNAMLYTKPWMAANPIAEIDNLFVDEAYRHHGAGTQLVAAFKVWAKAKGARYLKVGAFTNNHPALSFYAKQGFSNIETRFEQAL